MINTERLTIRLIEESDLVNIIPIHSDPLVNQYLPYETWENDNDAKAWFARVLKNQREGIAQQFVIERTDDKVLLGTCLFMHHDKGAQTADFGYVLARKYWGQGLMTEAMRAFADYLQKELNIKTLNAVVEVPNTNSIKLLISLGFSQGLADDEMRKENLIPFYRVLD